MRISIDEVKGEVQEGVGAAIERDMQEVARTAQAEATESLSVHVDDIERELRVRAERRARLFAD